MTQKGSLSKPEVEIEIINAVLCGVGRDRIRYILPALTYKRFFWRVGPKRKERIEYDDHFLISKGRDRYTFLTGHLRIVLKYCKENNIATKFVGESPSSNIPPYNDPHLNGITFRKDQLKMIRTASLSKRGILKAPTRTGKTIIQYGIISAFNGANSLILAHTKDLVNQLADEGKRFGHNVAVVHGTQKQMNWLPKGQVVVMTRQTCSNLIKENGINRNYFDIVIVDEAHHVSSPDGQYAKILLYFLAPLRYGFTATLPDNIQSELSLEGFIGSLISELTIEEAIEEDILVKPKIVIKKAPTVEIPKWADFQTAYSEGIVHNEERNLMIALLAREFNVENLSVLVLVTSIQHGYNVISAFREISLSGHFVYGGTPSETRDRIKKGLITKRIKNVVANVVWKEGINIPTLNVCINAAGGKSEITTLQSVGRSLTKAEGKDQAIIVDFFDPSHNYLISHFGERISLYCQQGWL